MVQRTNNCLMKTLAEEIEIAKYQPFEGIYGETLGELFDYFIRKYKTHPHFLCSVIYNLGKVHGVRKERNRRVGRCGI